MKEKFIEKIMDITEKLSRIRIGILIDIIKLIILVPISLILSPFLKRKNIWLIEEDKKQANDNGYALLKYIRKIF